MYVRMLNEITKQLVNSLFFLNLHCVQDDLIGKFTKENYVKIKFEKKRKPFGQYI